MTKHGLWKSIAVIAVTTAAVMGAAGAALANGAISGGYFMKPIR